MTERQFSSWKGIDIPCNRWEPAVYRIRLLASGSVAALLRLLGNDSDGIVNIGTTKSMESRRRQFTSGIAKCSGHSAGNLVWYLNDRTRFLQAYSDATFEYAYRCFPTEEGANEFEETLIKAYFRRFGEVPPLNSSIPKRYEEAGWERARDVHV